MKVTYFGHACFLVELCSIKLLFDPFITPNPLAKNVDISKIEADYILVSHGHIDHVADVEGLCKQTDATLISNFEIVSWFQNKGVVKGHQMNIGGQLQLSEKVRIKYVNAVHSSVLPDGAYGGNPGGWIIESTEGNFYYSGDTALTMDMQLLKAYHTLDFAFLCIGDNFTMGIVDATIASEFIGVNKVIGMHYDSFPPIKIDHQLAKQVFAQKGKELLLLDIEQTLEI